MSLARCIGCHQRIKKGKEYCHLKDDRNIIEDKMDAAEDVVFVSPVYMSHITALLKNFVDHFAYLLHRPNYFKKPARVFIHREGMFKEFIKYMERVARGWEIQCDG